MARIQFAGAHVRVRGYVNYIGEPRQAGQARVLDFLIGWSTAPRKGESEGRRQTIKASIWNSPGSTRDAIASFQKFVKRGDLIAVSGELELDEYKKGNGEGEAMMRIANVDTFEPTGRGYGSTNGIVNEHANQPELDPLTSIDEEIDPSSIPF